jgi:heme-degrading monooxygenase HmoA
MILEAGMLNVATGQEREFEAAFTTATPLISAMDGYLAHELHRCLEVSGKYLLLVHWRNLEDHTIGFRQSPEYLQWKQLLHQFYAVPPTVEHFELSIASVVPDRVDSQKPNG